MPRIYNQDAIDKARDTGLYEDKVRRNKAKKGVKLARQLKAKQTELHAARHEAEIERVRNVELLNVQNEKKCDKLKKRTGNTIVLCGCDYTFKKKYHEMVPICPGPPPPQNDYDTNDEPFMHAMDHLETLHDVLVPYMEALNIHIRLNGSKVGRAKRV